MATVARELFFHSGTQHYVAGRFAAIAALIPVAGNLLHHAVEMFMKGGLSATRTLDQLKGMGHNLPRIWSEWKSQYPDPAHTKFDGVITDLHPFEELRYPNAVLAHGAGVTIDMGCGPRPPPSGCPEPEYYLSVPEVDELVAVLFAAASVNPPYFTSRLRKVARDFLMDQNAVASSLTK
jgi:hypothetical protein